MVVGYSGGSFPDDVPTVFVVGGVVKHLAPAYCSKVSVVVEPVVDGNLVAFLLFCPDMGRKEGVSCRSRSRKKRRTGSTGHGNVAVCPAEHRSGTGQRVYDGGDYFFLAIAAEFRPKVVAGNQKQVLAPCGIILCLAGQRSAEPSIRSFSEVFFISVYYLGV